MCFCILRIRRLLQSICFCLSLLVCFEGLVNKILSARFWIPLSRLTYCAYLVHIIAIVALYGSFETVQAYSDVHIVSCVDFVLRNL